MIGLLFSMLGLGGIGALIAFIPGVRAWVFDGLAFACRHPREAIIIALALFSAWCWHHYRGAYLKLHGESTAVVSAIQRAAGHPVKWKNAAAEVDAMGGLIVQQREAIAETNQRVNDMAREAVRLKARADELRAIAEKAEAQRRAAYARLSDMAATPGTRSDCETLLREADEALNIVREASGQ